MEVTNRKENIQQSTVQDVWSPVTEEGEQEEEEEDQENNLM